MATHKTGISTMNAAASLPLTTAFIAPALSRHWVKRLARQIGVPAETARAWIYRELPAARRCQVARAVLAECDELERLIAETRRRWAEVAGDAGDAAGGAVACGTNDRGGAPAG